MICIYWHRYQDDQHVKFNGNIFWLLCCVFTWLIKPKWIVQCRFGSFSFILPLARSEALNFDVHIYIETTRHSGQILCHPTSHGNVGGIRCVLYGIDWVSVVWTNLTKMIKISISIPFNVRVAWQVLAEFLIFNSSLVKGKKIVI